MLFSTVPVYALRALIHLAAFAGEEPIQARHVAEAEGIPRHFLAKILSRLTYSGLVRASRGPGGGFTLARPAEKILVREVIDATEGLDAVRAKCVLGLPECSDERPCALHEDWKRAREQLLADVSDRSLAELAAAGRG